MSAVNSMANLMESCEGKNCPIKNYCLLGLRGFVMETFTDSYIYDTSIGPDGLARGCSEFVEIEKR
jgi:hypothetical protein